MKVMLYINAIENLYFSSTNNVGKLPVVVNQINFIYTVWFSSCFREEVMQTSEIMLIKYLLVCTTMHEFL